MDWRKPRKWWVRGGDFLSTANFKQILDKIAKNETSEDYCKADHNNIYCFFIVIIPIL